MGVFDLYSKRQKRLRGEVPDVYVYDEIPGPLRVQIVHILRDTIGTCESNHYDYVDNKYKFVHDSLCREYGIFKLVEKFQSYDGAVFSFFLSCDEYEQALDVIEFTFRVIDRHIREIAYYSSQAETKMNADGAIDELNTRFKEHGVGYRFESGELIRIDSEYIHSESVKPALELLRDKMYRGSNEEFLKAHEHYRHGRYKETLVEALKAFESVMKAICDKHKWQYGRRATARDLIQICISEGLIPSFLQSGLESGVPTIRNELGGHGQGTHQINVSEGMAGYALHLTAAQILFLGEQEKGL